jgi:hypothetical protein
MKRHPLTFGLATALALIAAGSAKLDAALINHWKFDETSGGTAADSTGGVVGTWQNGTSTNLSWTTGQIGGAADLGGQTTGNNYFSTGTLTTLSGATGLTLSAWINPDGFTGSTYEGIFTTRSTVTGSAIGNANWGFSWENGNSTPNPLPHLDSRTGNGVDSNPATIEAAGGWYHIALVWDGVAGTHKNYINGVETASDIGPVGEISGGVWHIGHDDCCGGVRDFDGQIDDLAIWDNALTGANILAIYNGGLAGIDAATSVPEPSGLALVGLSGLAFLRRRR